MADPAPTPTKPRARPVLGLAFGLAMLLLLELVLHLLPKPEPSLLVQPPAGQQGMAAMVMEGNPYLLWQLAPGQTNQRGKTVTVNSLGFRGPEIGPKTRPRLLTVGDSSVFGGGVGDGEVFTSYLNQSLPAAEFINGATPGYSSEQALNLLALKGLALEPDVLLVATLWSDNNKDAFVDADMLQRYAEWQGTERNLAKRLLSWSRLYGWLNLASQAVGGGDGANEVGWMREVDQATARTAPRRVPLTDYAENLAEFCRIMAERQGGVVFMVLSNTRDFVPADSARPWDSYRRVMRDTAQACQAPIISVPATFRASGRSKQDLFLDDMHPTPTGHALIAAELARTLRQRGWPQQPLQVVDPGGPVAVPEDPFDGADPRVEAKKNDGAQRPGPR